MSKPPEPPSDLRPLGYVLGGLGTAALVASASLGILVLQKRDQVNQQCTEQGCTAEGLQAARTGKTLSRLSTIGGLIAAPALGLGAYFVLSYDAPAPHRPSRGFNITLRGL